MSGLFVNRESMNELCCFRGMTVTSLLNRSVQCVLDGLPYHRDALDVLPANLKDKLLFLIASRGLFTDPLVARLVHSKVKSLDLSNCDVTDTALETISSKCQLLQIIKMNSAKEDGRPAITYSGVSLLGQRCSHLQVVSILRCPALTDQAVEALARGCPRLLQLSLGGCSAISDVSLKALGEHARFLQTLNITDDGICSLVSGDCAKTLMELHISGCVAITDESIEAILAFCPRLTYFLFQGCPLLTDAAREALQCSSQQTQMKHIAWTVY